MIFKHCSGQVRLSLLRRTRWELLVRERSGWPAISGKAGSRIRDSKNLGAALLTCAGKQADLPPRQLGEFADRVKDKAENGSNRAIYSFAAGSVGVTGSARPKTNKAHQSSLTGRPSGTQRNALSKLAFCSGTSGRTKIQPGSGIQSLEMSAYGFGGFLCQANQDDFIRSAFRSPITELSGIRSESGGPKLGISAYAGGEFPC